MCIGTEGPGDVDKCAAFGRRSFGVGVCGVRRGRGIGRLFPRSRAAGRGRQQTVASHTDAQTSAARRRRVSVRFRGRQRSPARRIDPTGRKPDRSVLVHGPRRQRNLRQVYSWQGRFPHNSGRSRAESTGVRGAVTAAIVCARLRATVSRPFVGQEQV